MIKLVVQIVISDDSGKESVPASLTVAEYSPDILEKLINDVLASALVKLKLKNLKSLRPFRPEISISISGMSDEGIRPAVHLSALTSNRLADAGTTFDFDPY